MQTFESLIKLTGDQARDVRAKNACRSTSNASRSLVEDLKQEFRDMADKLLNHTDLGQTDTTSLIISKDFNPKEWVSKLYDMQLKMMILAKKIELQVKMHNALFPDNQVSPLEEYELTLIANMSTEEAVLTETAE